MILRLRSLQGDHEHFDLRFETALFTDRAGTVPRGVAGHADV